MSNINLYESIESSMDSYIQYLYDREVLYIASTGGGMMSYGFKVRDDVEWLINAVDKESGDGFSADLTLIKSDTKCLFGYTDHRDVYDEFMFIDTFARGMKEILTHKYPMKMNQEYHDQYEKMLNNEC